MTDFSKISLSDFEGENGIVTKEIASATSKSSGTKKAINMELKLDNNALRYNVTLEGVTTVANFKIFADAIDHFNTL